MIHFVDENDYVVIGADALKILQQSSPEKRHLAEQAAEEEISGYLRGRYDVKKVFSQTGIDRNMQIVIYYCDIALYHLISWLPGKMGTEIREERYKRAVEWLEKVSAGKTIPDLPLPTGPNGEEDTYNPIRYGSGQKNNYDW